MPDESTYEMQFRPSYELEEFDRLVRVIDEIADAAGRDALRNAILESGDLDVDTVIAQYGLDERTASAATELLSFGDRDHQCGTFGSVLIAYASSGSRYGMVDLETFIFARWDGDGIVYESADENGGITSTLGRSMAPLTMREMVAMMNRHLINYAPTGCPPKSGMWPDAYFLEDLSMEVFVGSRFYPELERWYAESVSKWFAEHAADIEAQWQAQCQQRG